MPSGTDSSLRFSGNLPPALFWPALLAMLSGYLLAIYHLPLLDTGKFFVATFAVFFVPGDLILRTLKRQAAQPLFGQIEALAVGYVLIPTVYLFVRRVGTPPTPALIAVFSALFLLWLRSLCRGSDRRPSPVQLRPADYLPLSGLLIFSLMLLHVSHFTDAVLGGAGLKYRLSEFTETVYHQGLVNALAGPFPPLRIFASGTGDFSSYHLNMHLGMELVGRLTALSDVVLVYYCFPLLFFFLLVALPFQFLCESRAPVSFGLLAATLMFGSDLSFVPGLLGLGFAGYSSYPWVGFFPGTIWSIFTVNGYLPALLVFFLAAGSLARYLRDRQNADLLLFFVLAVCSVGFKSTMAVHLLAASAVFGAITWRLHEDFRAEGRAIAIGSAVSMVVLAVEIVAFRGGTGASSLSFSAFNLFYESLARLGLKRDGVAWFLGLYPCYLLAVFGCRAAVVLGLRKLLADPRQLPGLYLFVFLTVGYLIAEFFAIRQPDDLINNSVWFFSQGLIAGWLLLCLLVSDLDVPGKGRAVAVLVIVALALPSTVDFLRKRQEDSYLLVDSEDLAVVDFLKQTPPHAVVLFPPDYNVEPSLSAHFAGRPSFLATYKSFVDGKTLKDRYVTAKRFFSGQCDGEVRKRILRDYGIDYVYVKKADNTLRGNEFLELVYSNGKYDVYRFVPGDV